MREEGKGLHCVGGGKGLLCTGGDKGSAACGRRERVCYETVLFTVTKKTVFEDQNGINFKELFLLHISANRSSNPFSCLQG